MLVKYFQISFRRIVKDKLNVLINVIGLSTGLICFIFSSLYINYLKSYDKFHEKRETLYQIVRHDFTGEDYQHDFYSSYALAQALKNNFPSEINEMVSATSDYPFVVSSENVKLKTFGKFVEGGFFDIFTYKYIEGDPQNFKNDLKAIAISSNLAVKLYGNAQNSIGKIIEVKDAGDFKVSLVFELPNNTYDVFDFVIPLDNFFNQYPTLMDDWTKNSFKSFFLLNNNSDIAKLNEDLTRINQQYSSNEIRQKISAVRYIDLSLGAEFRDGEYQRSAMETVFNILTLMAIGVLLIACINYTNIATAKSLSKIKDIGIKKAIGISRSQLILQYFTDIFLISVFAVALSLIIAKIILPSFSNLVGLPLEMGFDFQFFKGIIFMVLFVTIVAGIYPAFYVSKINLLHALRGTIKGSFTDLLFRRGLVGFQFFISIILIFFVLILKNQIEFIIKKDVGHNYENILTIEASGELEKNPDTFLNEIRTIPGVINATTIFDGFYNESLYDNVIWEGKPVESNVFFNIRRVGADFFKTVEIEVKDGRPFNNFTDKPYTKAIINEEAVIRMGLTEPLSRTISFNGVEMDIIGVVKDVHLIPVYNQIEPLLFILSDDVNQMIVKIDEDYEGIVSKINDLATFFNPEYSFEYSFLEEARMVKFKFLISLLDLSFYLTVFAIIICFLGVYGLTAFSIERRKREIGIRKALGSGNDLIFFSLSYDFLKIISFVLILGLSISYLGLDFLLQSSFYYRIDIKLWYLVVPALVSFVAIFMAIGLQMSKVVKINPVEYIRER